MPTGTEVDERSVVLLDTSTAIALVLEDHERHLATLEAVAGRRLGLAGHAWFETYSVLTRLPPGQRRAPAATLRILLHNFPESRFLAPEDATQLGHDLARLGIAGGAVYDALVGAVARQWQLPLLSGDTRARPTYEALKVRVENVP